MLYSNIIPLVTSLREDVSKIEYENIRKILAKGPKYRGLQSINRKYNFKLLIDSVENYARKWTKREKEAVETFSEWVKSY
jgi:hypothetical protein